MIPTIHTPQTHVPYTQLVHSAEQEDAVDVRKYLGYLIDRRWLIASIALVVTLAGAAYAYLTPPVYESNLLVQVEDASPAPNNFLGNMTAGQDSKIGGTAQEMEVLRSRLVVAPAVERARLYINAEPNYFPVIGEFIARQNKELSEPGLFGYGGYAWGAEKIDVSKFDVPADLEGKPFELTLLDNGRFTLVQLDEEISLSGRVGETLRAPRGAGEIVLHVDRIAGKPGAGFSLTRQSRVETVKRLQEALQIAEKGKQSGIIGVTLEGDSPKRATEILGYIGQEYLAQNEERRSQNAEKLLVFLNRQLPLLKQDLELSESKYNDLRNRRGTVDLGEEGRGVLQQSTSIQTKIAELRQKKEELLIRFEEPHPAIQAINQQMQALQNEMARIEGKIRGLPSVEQDVLRMTRDMNVNREVYTAVLSTAHQLRLLTASRVGNVRLLDTPVASNKPVKPRKMLLIVLSAACGVFLGVLAALVRKSFYGRVDHPKEVEQTLGLPVSIAIPHSRSQKQLYAQIRSDSKEVAVLPHEAPSDSAIEGLRGLRSMLQVAMLEARNNIIMITGPTPGVGKSFVSANLATVLASTGKKVLLIDGDMRTGYLHRYFGLQRESGLSEILSGEIPFEQAINRNVVENTDFISTGELPGRPAELLERSELGKTLQLLSVRYDYVLIDTPPVLAFSDALTVGAHAGAIFNIVRGGVSTVAEIEETVRRLNQSGCKVTGTVFNDFKPGLSGAGYPARGDKYAYAA